MDNEGGPTALASNSPPVENVNSWPDQNSGYVICFTILGSYSNILSWFCVNWLRIVITGSSELKDSANNNNGVNDGDGDEVRPPLPVVRETLYDDVMHYGYVCSFLNIAEVVPYICIFFSFLGQA